MLWSIVWFTLFFIWIWLLIVVFADIFRSHDLGGFAKFLWVLFVVVVPYLGVFVYLIARGHKMSEHMVQDTQAADDAQRAYIREAAGTSVSTADELERLAALRSQGRHRRHGVRAHEGTSRRGFLVVPRTTGRTITCWQCRSNPG